MIHIKQNQRNNPGPSQLIAHRGRESNQTCNQCNNRAAPPPKETQAKTSPFTHRQQTDPRCFTSKHNFAGSQSLSKRANRYLITLMHHIIGASAGGGTNWGTRPGLGIKKMYLSKACLITWQKLTDNGGNKSSLHPCSSPLSDLQREIL